MTLLPAQVGDGAADDKRAAGRFYTRSNPFNNAPFRAWARDAGLPGNVVLEPFAGGNHLITMLKDAGLCARAASFDITPGAPGVRRRDTLRAFPRGYDVCVTNPPWLARNSATRRRLPFPQTPFDDLYKHCLSLSIAHCRYVAALVPESFICSGLFLPRLRAFVSLNCGMFADTDHPVGLALFGEESNASPALFCGDKRLGTLAQMRQHCPPPSINRSGGSIVFNAPDGNVGLLALDNTSGASIRFCDAAELGGYKVRQSCRAITKIKIPGKPKIAAYNRYIKQFRAATMDVFLTAYRGLRKDGYYRRRLDYALARDIIRHIGY